MQKIDALLKLHVGETAIVCGKGPSLDHFDFVDAAPLRICINESLRAVPHPTYFFSHDEGPIQNLADDWPECCRAILQPVRAEFAAHSGIPEDSLVTYTKGYLDNTLRDMDAEAIARSQSLYGNSGTVHSAIHFCRLIGVESIIMVGFDGTGGYAKRLGLPDGGAQHDRIRRDAESLLTALSIPYRFWRPRK